jgi:hypothetical protein
MIYCGLVVPLLFENKGTRFVVAAVVGLQYSTTTTTSTSTFLNHYIYQIILGASTNSLALNHCVTLASSREKKTKKELREQFSRCVNHGQTRL